MDGHENKEDIKDEESNEAENTTQQYDQGDDDDSPGSKGKGDRPPQKRAGRRKINIEFIKDKSRRHITFSKRKAGIMKKAYELSTLTGTQVLLLVASETGHVYTFATPKLQPLITKTEGKNLIQACLNAPDSQQLGGDQGDMGGMDGGGQMGMGQSGYSMDDLDQSKKMRGDMKAMPVNQGYGQMQQMPPSPSPQSYGLPTQHHQQSLPSLQNQSHQSYGGLDMGSQGGYGGGMPPSQQDYGRGAQQGYGNMTSPTLPHNMSQYGGYGATGGSGQGLQDPHKVTIYNNPNQYSHQQ